MSTYTETKHPRGQVDNAGQFRSKDNSDPEIPIAVLGIVYAARDDAVDWEVIRPIEASGVVTDARAEFDVDAIADAVLTDTGRGWKAGQEFADAETGADAFWNVVEQNIRPS